MGSFPLKLCFYEEFLVVKGVKLASEIVVALSEQNIILTRCILILPRIQQLFFILYDLGFIVNSCYILWNDSTKCFFKFKHHNNTLRSGV